MRVRLIDDAASLESSPRTRGRSIPEPAGYEAQVQVRIASGELAEGVLR